MMKTRLLFLILLPILLILHLSSINSHAIFSIELKNGRNVFAENYLIEGNNIILYLKSGSVNIQKDEVKSIREEKVELKEGQENKPTEEKIGIRENLDRNKCANSLSTEKKRIEFYVQQKAEMQKKLEEAKEVYFKLTERSEKERARETMIAISKELFSLEEEIMKNNNGIVPEWWKEKPKL
jgi:hypothetical protein